MDPTAVGVIGVLLTLGLLFGGCMWAAQKMRVDPYIEHKEGVCKRCHIVTRQKALYCHICGFPIEYFPETFRAGPR